MRSSAAFRGPKAKRLFHHLIMVNILVISLDVTILAFQYAGLYRIQTSWKTLAYSIKLKFEFDILHQLVDFARRGFGNPAPSESQYLSGRFGEGLGSRSAVRELDEVHMGGSRHVTSSYARMDEHDLKDLPPQKVRKTTDIHVEVDEDTLSDGSTRELRT
jgi:hypothetical protein